MWFLTFNSLQLECTLFGQYVDMLNAFLASREDQHVVIAKWRPSKVTNINHIITVVLMNKNLFDLFSFVDKVSIQNCMNCTKIIFNCDGEDATKLKKM